MAGVLRELEEINFLDALLATDFVVGRHAGRRAPAPLRPDVQTILRGPECSTRCWHPQHSGRARISPRPIASIRLLGSDRHSPMRSISGDEFITDDTTFLRARP